MPTLARSGRYPACCSRRFSPSRTISPSARCSGYSSAIFRLKVRKRRLPATTRRSDERVTFSGISRLMPWNCCRGSCGSPRSSVSLDCGFWKSSWSCVCGLVGAITRREKCFRPSTATVIRNTPAQRQLLPVSGRGLRRTLEDRDRQVCHRSDSEGGPEPAAQRGNGIGAASARNAGATGEQDACEGHTGLAARR